MSEQSMSTVEERRQRLERIVWRLYNEGWFAGNLDLMRELLDPGIVWTAIEDAPDAGTYRGYEGVRAYWQDWLDDFEMHGGSIEESIEAGDRLVCVQRAATTGKGSRVRSEIRYACGYTFGADERIVELNEYATREEALAAANVSPDLLDTLGQFRAAFLAGNEAFNRGDFAAAFASLPPDCEWHSVAYATERVLVGPDQVCRFFEDEIFGMFQGWRSEPVHFLQAGDGVFVVLMSGHGTGVSSGAPVHLDLSEVWELRGGVPVRVREFPTWDEALSAAGLDPSSAGELRKAER